MKSSTNIFRLLDLPLELRDKIYCHLLEELPTCASEATLKLSLLRISKRVSSEILETFHRRAIYTYRITPHCSGLDPLTLACISRCQNICEKNLGHCAASHLVVEILGPLTVDVIAKTSSVLMIAVLGRLQKFCRRLKNIGFLRKLSIRFVESRSAKWSIANKPNISIHSDDHHLLRNLADGWDDECRTQYPQEDMARCMAPFRGLTNVDIATFHFPCCCLDTYFDMIRPDIETHTIDVKPSALSDYWWWDLVDIEIVPGLAKVVKRYGYQATNWWRFCYEMGMLRHHLTSELDTAQPR